MDLPVSSYAIYVDKLPLDGVSAQPVIKLLQKMSVPCSERYVPPSKESSHLYMWGQRIDIRLGECVSIF